MKRILYIEDKEEMQELLPRLIKTCVDVFHGETEFVPALTFAEGESLVKQGKIDVVLLDLGLTDSGTEETIGAIARISATWPPIVVFTGNASLENRTRCLTNGASDFIQKIEVINKPEVILSILERAYNAALKRSVAA